MPRAPRVTDAQLIRAARTASRRAYAPYSGFPVGAAVLTGGGRIYTGTNVENASYGLCNCAERTAIFAAVAAGERDLRCVAIFTPTPTPTAPCGACRQVIHEFSPTARIIGACSGSYRLDTTLDELLPAAFGPAALK